MNILRLNDGKADVFENVDFSHLIKHSEKLKEIANLGAKMVEYEYNFKVDDISVVTKFCEENGFVLVSKTSENRVVFENKQNRKIISRLTTTFGESKKVTVWDFKNVGKNDNLLKVSKESEAMVLDESGIKIARSMLEVMDFEQSADNLRTRYVFEKGDVKFEIDDYTRPQMKVVAIEGEKSQVDKVYQMLVSDEQVSKHIL